MGTKEVTFPSNSRRSTWGATWPPIRGRGCLLTASQKCLTLLSSPENRFLNHTDLKSRPVAGPSWAPGEKGAACREQGPGHSRHGQPPPQRPLGPLWRPSQQHPSVLSAPGLPWNRSRNRPPGEASSQRVFASARAGLRLRGSVSPGTLTPAKFPSRRS